MCGATRHSSFEALVSREVPALWAWGSARLREHYASGETDAMERWTSQTLSFPSFSVSFV